MKVVVLNIFYPNYFLRFREELNVRCFQFLFKASNDIHLIPNLFYVFISMKNIYHYNDNANITLAIPIVIYISIFS